MLLLDRFFYCCRSKSLLAMRYASAVDGNTLLIIVTVQRRIENTLKQLLLADVHANRIDCFLCG